MEQLGFLICIITYAALIIISIIALLDSITQKEAGLASLFTILILIGLLNIAFLIYHSGVCPLMPK